ncbi:MAG: type I DNA topoisomerase [Deltaproteobacteria bacterium]|nr:type I DNA topoisomerase [Deltaproteobacteria bacterium]
MAQKKTTENRRQAGSQKDTSGKQLVIVESPAKARTINKYLGKDYVVMASVGHVRDLPDKNPKGIKDPVPGVDLDNDFRPTYQIIKGKAKTVRELKQAARKASGIWLATDLDREGEAIAWHLAEALGIDPEEGKRVVFNAITKEEIEKAFKKPRKIDMNKVNAQQARRILDRIVGYQVSPLLWKKVAGGLSAGRVQSVAVRLIVEREREIESFVPEEYWKLTGFFTVDPENATRLGESFRKWLFEVPVKDRGRRQNGRTIHERNQWLSQHSSFSGELVEISGKKFLPKSEAEVLETLNLVGYRIDEREETVDPKAKGPQRKLIRLKGHVFNGPPWKVKSIQTKRTKSRPLSPFITSTLQQAAANQLDFSAQTTMRTAQALYEGVPIADLGSVGLITYMRTDSPHLSNEAILMAREYIRSKFGPDYLPERPNVFTSSNKSAQEAHEAIRPTDVTLTPEKVRSSLTDRQYKLYKLIWERFVASQMTDALWDATTVLISETSQGKEFVFKATGRVLVFDGYYKISGVPNHSDEAILPPLSEGRPLGALHMEPTQNFTLPPPRYSEASLIRKLEAEGIGRPSTYAQIIQVIQDRKYVEKVRNRFHATDLGKVVTDKLVEAFPEIMEVGYTRDMEQQLDDIEEKHADWVQMLRQFYGPFKSSLDAAYQKLGHAKAETEPAPHSCPECGSGTVYRFGRNGRFLSCADYPKCKYAAPIDAEGNPVADRLTDVACPKCGSPMKFRKGRFGPFLSCPNYPQCDGILKLDSKGQITPPKPPPLLTDIPCPKCGSPLNLRRGARGPWLSCSTFPKCRGRLGWKTLKEDTRKHWEKALEEHEKAHPQPVLKKTDGTSIGEAYSPQFLDSTQEQEKKGKKNSVS